MRALVIDDELLVLEGLEAFLQASLPELSLDKTSDVGTALRLISTFRYQLVLLDWHLMDVQGDAINGRVVVEAIRACGVDVPILVVSGDSEAEWGALALSLGLAGMVPKRASGLCLLEAIQVALGGGIYLPRIRPGQTIRKVNPVNVGLAKAPAADPRKRFPELTERQADVFKVMMRGMSDKQIARELGIAETTVKTHVRGILDVVGVRRRGEAVFEINHPRSHE